MSVSEDERPPGADVIDVALAVGVPEVRTLAAREEARRAADGAERAHRRVDTSGNDGLRLLEQRVVATHAAAFLENRSLNARARAAMSLASNSAVMTASASAPASIADAALSSVMPPIATTVTPKRRAAPRSASGARTAAGLVGEANIEPKAM